MRFKTTSYSYQTSVTTKKPIDFSMVDNSEIDIDRMFLLVINRLWQPNVVGHFDGEVLKVWDTKEGRMLKTFWNFYHNGTTIKGELPVASDFKGKRLTELDSMFKRIFYDLSIRVVSVEPNRDENKTFKDFQDLYQDLLP